MHIWGSSFPSSSDNNSNTHTHTRVLIVQSDNRLDTLDFLTLSKRSIEEKVIPHLEKYRPFHTYTYAFIDIPRSYYQSIHPATAKIQIVSDILEGKLPHPSNSTDEPYDILVFLDSDAWINAPDDLNALIILLQNHPDKHGCFSRDPCKMVNTYINSGSFLLKINDFNRQMYRQIIQCMENDPSHHQKWPYDQYYISNRIWEQKESFFIFQTELLNTPFGLVLKHNWKKNNRMYYDLYQILESSFQFPILKPMDFFAQLDNSPFPNPDDSGLNYDD
jgi:hypothetical protein